MLKKKKICRAYISKHSSNCEKQVIILMTSNGEKQWHHLAVKKLSALLRGITSKHHDDFHCLNCFDSFGTESKLQSHKRVCGNKDFVNIIMSSEDIEMLEFNNIKNLIKHHLLFMQIMSV